MFSFKSLILSIAGLWALCLIQNQIHPHRYVDFCNYTQDTRCIHSAPVKTGIEDSPSHPQTFLSFLVPESRLFEYLPFVTDKTGHIVSNPLSRKKRYRLFLSGLSPPSFSFS